MWKNKKSCAIIKGSNSMPDENRTKLVYSHQAWREQSQAHKPEFSYNEDKKEN